jgi:hypothetical protein
MGRGTPERILPSFPVLSIHIWGLRLRFPVWTLDISTALGTETLAGREMMLDNVPNSRDSIPIELVGGRRFLKVDQTANLRAGSKVSKIREHGFEYRSLDNRPV